MAIPARAAAIDQAAATGSSTPTIAASETSATSRTAVGQSAADELSSAPASPSVESAATPNATPAADASEALADGGEAQADSADHSADLSDVEAPDDTALSGELQEAARELEDLREAEAATIDLEEQRAGLLLELVHRGNPASALHGRLEHALDSSRLLPIVSVLPGPEDQVTGLADFDLERARRLYDIPIDMHPLVAQYVRFFQTSGRKHFVKWLGRASKYLPMMRKELKEAGLPEDTVYLSMIESGFSPMALSWAKAAGLWQFIEPTGKRFSLKTDFWIDQRRDPVRSTRAAAGFLKELYGQFGDWRLAWAGYNAGGGKVRRAIQNDATTDFWEMTEGHTLKPETKHYVPKLMAAALIGKNLKAFGFSEDEFTPQPPLEFETAEVPEATDLEVIARAAGVPVSAIKELNPELRRWCTPPSRSKDDVYLIKLPTGTREAFAENFAKIAPKDRLTFRVHKVVRGDTLSQIAARHGSAVEAIMRMNGLRDSRRLRLGAELVVPVPSAQSRERLAVQARKSGFAAAPAEQEIPAAAPPKRSRASGVVSTVREGGRTRVTYAVAEGDSLWSIARHFDVTVEKLRGWNDLRAKRATLRIGQQLVLYTEAQVAAGSTPAATRPSAAAAPSQPPPARQGIAQHVVGPGDTLWSLAQRYRVSVDQLKRWNGLSDARSLRIGQTLEIRAPDA